MLDKLINFYLKLPEDIFNELENLDYNRETRRYLKKSKKIKTKIKYIMKSDLKHHILIDFINKKFNYITNENTAINVIIDSINKTNFIQSMLYMMKIFLNDNSFKEYVLSEDYDRHIKTFMDSNVVKKENKDNNMEKNIEYSDKYIVTIKEENTSYYNIYPLFKLDKGYIIEVAKDDYPDYGNINVRPYREFSNKDYHNLYPLWICRLSQDQLIETDSKTKSKSESRTVYSINGDDLVRNKTVYNINKEGIYEIVELLENDDNIESQLLCNDLVIEDEPISKKIFIKDENYIYGPFGYTEDNQSYYLDSEKYDFIVNKYPINKNKLNFTIREIDIYNNYYKPYATLIYFNSEKKLISETIDIISDEELLNKLKSTISTKNSNYSRRDIQELKNNLKNIIDTSLSQDRIKRIKNLINNTEITKNFVGSELVSIIELLLEEEKYRNIIAEKILLKPENLRKLQNVEIVQSQIDNKKQELEVEKKKLSEVKEELGQAKKEIENINKKSIDELIEKDQKDIKELTVKIEELQKNYNMLLQKYNLCDEIDILNKEVKDKRDEASQAQTEYNVFRRKIEDMEKEAKKIEKIVKDKLDNAINYYPDIAFDGVIANEMLESAAKWSKKKHIENFEQSICSRKKVIDQIDIKSFKNKEIIDYIYTKVKETRDYSKNDIINIMICLTQGFLTVFAGEPGVGKTSICNIIAKTLGLSNNSINYNRFTEISVEKGWTSKRDLIGYYNPLTKSFDKNNGSLYKTFNILHQEHNKNINDFPYYILLDEANLSSMEHYWADFMNVCDLDKEKRKINLGEDYVYDIPQTLRFLATINYDHTTETLSPRLIDRAWIILLEHDMFEIDDFDSYLRINEDECKCDGLIMFQDLIKCFSYTSYNDSNDESIHQIKKELHEFYKIFREHNIFISSRVHKMIENYLKTGCNLFKKTEATSYEYVALDYAIAQKILPTINGYGEEYETFLKSIMDKFDKKNMMKCKNIVNNIIKKGNINMKYYQFFY